MEPESRKQEPLRYLCSSPDSWADPKSRSTLGLCNLHHKSIRVQNWWVLGFLEGSSSPMLATLIGGEQPSLTCTWISNMSKATHPLLPILFWDIGTINWDPVLPVLFILVHWAIVLGTFGGSGGASGRSRLMVPTAIGTGPKAGRSSTSEPWDPRARTKSNR